MPRPLPADYPPFYASYIARVPEENIQQAFSASLQQLRLDLSQIGSEKADYAYAPGKWTVKQLLQHVIDSERIFAYRALCIARGEQQSLPGFDENAYAAAADVSRKHIKDLKEEFLTVRLSTIQLFQGLSDDVLGLSGISNLKPITALSIGFIIIGHWRHHAAVLQEQYGIGE